MTVEARALSTRRIREESAVIRLLRADMAPIILAILGEAFPRGTGRVPAAEFYEFTAGAFDVLRNAGFEIKRTPAEYAAEWVKAGYLGRRSGTATTGEMFEPSRESLLALRIIEQLDGGSSTVTASRIQSIAAALRTLDRETDPDQATRREILLRQREEIDRELERLEQDDFEVLPPIAARERILDILDQAAAIPADFARVRQELEKLNLTLRRELLDSAGGRGTVLEQIFDGVDLISQSEAGRSFTGFFEILIDPETIAYIEQHIGNVSSRMRGHLGQDEAARFATLFTTFEEEAGEVNGAMTALARNLRHYVVSEQFAEDRRLVELIRTARKYAADAVEASDLSPIKRMQTPLTRIGMDIRSIGALQLRNPGAEIVEEPLVEHTPSEGSLEALIESVRESEIDFEELEGAIDAALSTRLSATIGDVLEISPATQGLASAVGLVILGLKAAEPTDPYASVGASMGARAAGRGARVATVERHEQELISWQEQPAAAVAASNTGVARRDTADGEETWASDAPSFDDVPERTRWAFVPVIRFHRRGDGDKPSIVQAVGNNGGQQPQPDRG